MERIEYSYWEATVGFQLEKTKFKNFKNDYLIYNREDGRKTGMNNSFLLKHQTVVIAWHPVSQLTNTKTTEGRFRNEGVCCRCLMQCGAGDETILFLLHRNRFWLLGFSANCADLRRPSGISTEPLLHKQQKSKSNFLCLSGNNKTTDYTRGNGHNVQLSHTQAGLQGLLFYLYHSSFTRLTFYPIIISFQNATNCQSATLDTACALYFQFIHLDNEGWTDLSPSQWKEQVKTKVSVVLGVARLVSNTQGTIIHCHSLLQFICVYF